MAQLYQESEHQELFYCGVDPHEPISIHVPSALGQLGYYVYLRVPQAQAEAFADASVHLRVAGLRPDDVTLQYGENRPGEPVLPSEADDRCWVVFCRALLSRGDGVVEFSGVPDEITCVDLLLCTWPRFVTSGQADDWIACQADPLWAPVGVPLGGIGTGKVELSRDGRFRNFSGNNNQDMPFEEPDGLAGAYLAVGRNGQDKVLASRPAAGLPPVDKLTAVPAFPQMQLTAPDAFSGIDVAVTGAGPLVPHDLELSSLPGFLLRWTIRNRTASDVVIRCRLAWPNLVGRGGCIGKQESRIGYADGAYNYWEAPDGGNTSVLDGDGFQALMYTNKPSPHGAAADGCHYLAVAGEVELDPAGLATVTVTVTAPAGGEKSADMVVVWEMPHWIDSLNIDRGMYWQNHCTDGMAVIRRLLDNRERILERGGALHRLLQNTDLPAIVKERLVNCCYPLVTNSVFFRDGRFSINEGPTEMAGCYGTLDQRLGAHPATFLLFPELNRRELSQFADYQADDGGVNHDFGGGHLDRGAAPQNWPDLTCSFIIQLAKHAWLTGDTGFEQENWPRVKKAMECHRQWAAAGNGVAQVGDGLGTSYDGYHYYGTTGYMATLWIAALQVMRRWAGRMEEADLMADIEPLIAAARKRLEEDLWNGSFYRAYGSPDGPVNEACHAGMLAGEWYARQLTGDDVLPPDRLDACASALLELNCSNRFAAPPDEVTPDGKAVTEYGWLPYVESFGLAPLALLRGKEVLPAWTRVLTAMAADGQRLCDTRLMYRPSTGEPSWGSYYMTAPASWLVYGALIDFKYEPEDSLLRLAPKIDGALALVHPLFWARAEKQNGRCRITVRDVFAREAIYVQTIEKAAPAEDPEHYERDEIDPVELKPGAVLDIEL